MHTRYGLHDTASMLGVSVERLRPLYSMHEVELNRRLSQLLTTKYENEGIAGPTVPVLLKQMCPVISRLIQMAREGTNRRRSEFYCFVLFRFLFNFNLYRLSAVHIFTVGASPVIGPVSYCPVEFG